MSLLNLGSNMEYSLKIWFNSSGLGTLLFASSPDFLANMGLDGLGMTSCSSNLLTSSSRYLPRRGLVPCGARCKWDLRKVGSKRPIDPWWVDPWSRKLRDLLILIALSSSCDSSPSSKIGRGGLICLSGSSQTPICLFNCRCMVVITLVMLWMVDMSSFTSA